MPLTKTAQHQPTQAPTSSHSPASKQKDDKRINHLFVRLAVIYGHLWKSLYQTEDFLSFAKQEWQDSLTSFDDATLDKAIAHCKQHEPYPPSLPMFADICKSTLKKEVYFSSAQQDEKPCSPEVARMHLARMKEMLLMPSSRKE